MIYFICSLMVTLPDGSKHTKDLHGYGQQVGTMLIIDLSRDAEFNGYTSTENLRSFHPTMGECIRD